MNNLTPAQRIDIVEIYFREQSSFTKTLRGMRQKYGRNFNVTWKTVSKIIQKFRANGNISDRAKCVRQRPKRSNENIELVRADVERERNVSYRRRAQKFSLSGTTLRRILKHDLHLFPYKIQITQQLLATDKPRRLNYGNQMLRLGDNESDFWTKIIMSDEAHFTLNGQVNKQNIRYWGAQNPIVTHEKPLYDQKVTVWCGVSATKIYGPFFFEDDEGVPVTVNGNRYRSMIEDWFWPQIAENDSKRMWFQQDGAPCHTARETMTLLRRLFPNRLISKNGDYDWPPRSPDLTPPDFFLWGYLKSKVYVGAPRSLQELKDAIRKEITEIMPETLQKVMENTQKRAFLCVVHKGDYLPDVVFKK